MERDEVGGAVVCLEALVHVGCQHQRDEGSHLRRILHGPELGRAVLLAVDADGVHLAADIEQISASRGMGIRVRLIEGKPTSIARNEPEGWGIASDTIDGRPSVEEGGVAIFGLIVRIMHVAVEAVVYGGEYQPEVSVARQSPDTVNRRDIGDAAESHKVDPVDVDVRAG